MSQEQESRVPGAQVQQNDEPDRVEDSSRTCASSEPARVPVMELAQFLENRMPVLIVGVGDAERSDDGVGLVVARALKTKNFANTTIVESSGDGALLSQLWQDAAMVFLIDAVSSGARPGTVRRIDARARQLPTDLFRGSTHKFGLAEAVELARALNQLPPRLIVYGIEGKDFGLGLGLSPEIVDAARRVVGSLTHELRAYRRRIPRGAVKPAVAAP